MRLMDSCFEGILANGLVVFRCEDSLFYVKDDDIKFRNWLAGTVVVVP